MASEKKSKGGFLKGFICCGLLVSAAAYIYKIVKPDYLKEYEEDKKPDDDDFDDFEDIDDLDDLD
jgi:hypothetical protein